MSIHKGCCLRDSVQCRCTGFSLHANKGSALHSTYSAFNLGSSSGYSTHSVLYEMPLKLSAMRATRGLVGLEGLMDV